MNLLDGIRLANQQQMASGIAEAETSLAALGSMYSLMSIRQVIQNRRQFEEERTLGNLVERIRKTAFRLVAEGKSAEIRISDAEGTLIDGMKKQARKFVTDGLITVGKWMLKGIYYGVRYAIMPLFRVLSFVASSAMRLVFTNPILLGVVGAAAAGYLAYRYFTRGGAADVRNRQMRDELVGGGVGTGNAAPIPKAPQLSRTQSLPTPDRAYDDTEWNLPKNPTAQKPIENAPDQVATLKRQGIDKDKLSKIRKDLGKAPNSYKSPIWDEAESIASQVTGVPQKVLWAIRTAGERSNSDQISPVGAMGVYQFMPKTRDLFLAKYGVDAFSQDPIEQALALALHLKESYARTGDWVRACAGYNGGISGEKGTNRTKENLDYTARIRKALGYAPDYDPSYSASTTAQASGPIATPNKKGDDWTSATPVEVKDGIESQVDRNGRVIKFQTPTYGKITSLRANRFHPTLKIWRAHRGIDIGAPAGTPVYAAHDGLAYTRVASGYGNLLRIVGDKYQTWYAHLSSFVAKNKQVVKRGQLVGRVGMTGGISSGNHLHFEVRDLKGNDLDIQPFVAFPVAKGEDLSKADTLKSISPEMVALNSKQTTIIKSGNKLIKLES